jgi:hypothetical protein
VRRVPLEVAIERVAQGRPAPARAMRQALVE